LVTAAAVAAKPAQRTDQKGLGWPYHR
jgi:hypothetical protein